MSHPDLSHPTWYGAIMEADAMLGPDFAEDRYYPRREVVAMDESGRLVLPPLVEPRARGMWTGAFMDCLIEGRGYDRIGGVTR